MSTNWVTQNSLEEYIRENLFSVEPERRYRARCTDGRYPYSPELEPLSIPGADAGELAIWLAATRQYGIEFDREKMLHYLVEMVGGLEHMRMHTDDDSESRGACGGCRHMRLINTHPTLYGLTSDDVKWIFNKCEFALTRGAKQWVLEGAHQSAALLMVEGVEYSVYPSMANQQVSVFHKGLIDARHQELCSRIVANEIITMPIGCSHEYLYQIVSEITDNHLMQTATQVARGVPIYQVRISDSGREVKVVSLGNV